MFEKRGESAGTKRMGRGVRTAMAALSLFTTLPAEAQRGVKHRTETVAVRAERPNPQALAHCRQLVAKAWALVRAGVPPQEWTTIDIEETLDCIDSKTEVNKLMDAMDAVQAGAKKQSGKALASRS